MSTKDGSRSKFKPTEYLGVLLIVGLGTWFLLWPAFQNVRDSFTCKSWTTTDATITSSKKMRRTGGSSARSRTSYKFRYKYTVEGQEYSGWRYSLSFPSGSQRSGVKKYHVGQTIPIRYNASSPSRSVIDPDATVWWNYLVLGGCGFVGFFACRKLLLR